MKFQTTIFQDGNNTGINVPAEVVDALGSGKKPAVHVSIGDYTYRSTVAVMGGLYLIPFNSSHRAATGIKGGDEVEVTLELDTEPRTIEAPDDFRAALDADEAVAKFYDALSYSLKRYWVEQVEGAKTAETRQRRIEGAIAKFRDGKSR